MKENLIHYLAQKNLYDFDFGLFEQGIGHQKEEKE